MRLYLYKNKKKMVYTLGESLLDIIFENQQNAVAKAGGGMLNTSVSLARSGVGVSLISELGDDKTAEIILQFLAENKVDAKFIKKYYHQKSTVALAFLNEQKVASFSIYKSYPQKRRLIYPENLSDKDMFVFGSLYSLFPEIRSEVKMILTSAKKAGSLICYDPNIRSHDLSDPEIRNALVENIAFADIVKASDEDMRTIFGELNPQEHFEEIQKINPNAVFVITLGAEGVVGFIKDCTVELPAKEVEVVSTIGAGDAFNAGIVYFLEKAGFADIRNSILKEENFREMLHSGLNFSAEVCTTLENYVGIR